MDGDIPLGSLMLFTILRDDRVVLDVWFDWLADYSVKLLEAGSEGRMKPNPKPRIRRENPRLKTRILPC